MTREWKLDDSTWRRGVRMALWSMECYGTQVLYIAQNYPTTKMMCIISSVVVLLTRCMGLTTYASKEEPLAKMEVMTFIAGLSATYSSASPFGGSSVEEDGQGYGSGSSFGYGSGGGDKGGAGGGGGGGGGGQSNGRDCVCEGVDY
ncbi:hypothetical protein Tco_0856900 [Tanacetum coccineum]|uniref:Uncharacterized protein n=1 Tax=Tanacetum coccineum TaxID=301880 RepID=A0ABQ5B8I9_9ASTR